MLSSTSRRRFLAVVAGGVVAASGRLEGRAGQRVGASAGAPAGGRTIEPLAAPVDTAVEGAFPRTVGRDFAVATIDAPPRRVVATADRDQLDVLVAMEVTPVLYGRSGDYETVAPWIDREVLSGIDSVAMRGAFEPNLEAIAAARPDLIVDAWAAPSGQALLAQIAPTIQIKLDNTDSWQSAQRLTGQAMGLEDVAEAAIAATEDVLAGHADRLIGLAGLSIAVAFIDVDALVMIPGDEIGARILTELELTVHPTPDGRSGRYSIEAVPELLGDADMIVSFDFAMVGGQEVNPLFAALPAVQAGRSVVVDVETATACYQESTLSIRWAASRIADALLA